jgi:hypothetical protein
MAPQPKKIELTDINPQISIAGIALNSAIASVQIDVKPDGTATFFIIGSIPDPNEVDQFKNYLNQL